VRALRKDGWKLKIDSVESFCQEWVITRSSFYRAKAKLISLHLIQEEIQGPLELWAKPTNPEKSPPAAISSPWITETGQVDPEFWEFILQERVRKLPNTPACPEAVAQTLIEKHGHFLWQLWEQEQASLAKTLQKLAAEEQEATSEIAALSTLSGRMEWLHILWSNPHTRWRAKKWMEENGERWGITCTEAGPVGPPGANITYLEKRKGHE